MTHYDMYARAVPRDTTRTGLDTAAPVAPPARGAPPRLLALATAAALVAGCADMGPVRGYAGETKKFTAAFSTLPEATVGSCRSGVVLGEQTRAATAPFAPAAARERAAKTCAGLSDKSQAILALTGLLERYADSLAALADDKLPQYDDEIKGVQDALGTLKEADGSAVINADMAGAVASLGKLLARLATQRAAQSEVRNLLDQGPALDGIVQALRWYVDRITRPALKRYTMEIDALLATGLPHFESREPLGARAMMVSLDAERERIAKLDKATDDFIAAADKLQAARAEVRDHLDHPDTGKALQQLAALGKEIQALHKQLGAAF